MSAETAPKESQLAAPEAPDGGIQNDAPPSGGSTPPAGVSAEPAKKKRPAWLLPVLLVAVVAGGIYGVRAFLYGQTHSETDDAQVASRLASVAPRVNGTVTKVYVDDNTYVKKGTLLVEIDPSNYQTALDQAQANLALAQAQERQAEVNVNLTSQTGNAQIAQAQGGVSQNESAVGASEAEVERSQAAVATAQSQAAGAQANVRSAQAAYSIALANVRKAQDSVREAQANAANAKAAVSSAQAAVVSEQATEERAQKDYQRFQQLFSQGAISAQSLDQAVSASRVATAQREAAQQNVTAAQAVYQQRLAAIATARSNVTAAQSQADQATAQIQASRVSVQGAQDAVRQAQAAVGSAQANVSAAQGKVKQAQGTLQQANTAGTQVEVSRVALQQAKARVKQAQAALEDAQLNVGYTKIVAPIDGKVSRRTATVGQQVAAGTPLMQIVPDNDIWVVANYKETQLKDVRVGQPVEIEVDALGGEKIHGKVESLSPNTGAAVALLPPDNATGNFTKVVQRVPVKIVFDSGQEDVVKRLAVGMSVVTTIDTERH